MYEYMAKVIRVVDGDTVWLDVDLGCDVRLKMSVRLAGINAPEMSTAEGVASKKFAEDYMNLNGGSVILHTTKDKREKYGRYLGTIFGAGELVSLNDSLVDHGHAIRMEY